MNTISLSLNRIKYLFIEYFISYWKRDLIILGAFFFVKTFCGYKGINFFPDEIIIMLLPCVLCGTFNYLNKTSKGMSYLICPANTEEKVIIRILLVHVYYSVILLLPCILGNFTLNILNHTQYPIIFLSQIRGFTFTFWVFLLLPQSIFIFAPVYLRKHAILKAAIFFGILWLAIILIVKDMPYKIEVKIWQFILRDMFEVLFRYGASLILIFFFWFMSYLRLKETEV